MFVCALQVAQVNVASLEEPTRYFAHILSALCSIVQACCNPDHERDPSTCITPHLPVMFGLLDAVSGVRSVDDDEGLLYACELLESLANLYAGSGQDTITMISKQPAVVKIMAQVAAVQDLEENHARVKEAMGLP